MIIGGALVSAVRFARNPQLPDHGRLAGANALIALGTLVLSSGGLVQGVVGHDEAFALSLAVGHHGHLRRIRPRQRPGPRPGARS